MTANVRKKNDIHLFIIGKYHSDNLSVHGETDAIILQNRT